MKHLILGLTASLMLAMPAQAGTGKQLTWCSYYAPESGATVNRMRCTYTVGISSYYCFRSAQMANGSVMDLTDCEKWSAYVSDRDVSALQRHLGIRLRRTSNSAFKDARSNNKVQIFKSKRTNEIAIIHTGDNSYEKDKCDSLGYVVAGEVREGDRCWLD